MTAALFHLPFHSLERLKGRSFEEVFDRTRQKLTALSEQLGMSTQLRVPCGELLAKLYLADYQRGQCTLGLLDHFRTLSCSAIFAGCKGSTSAPHDFMTQRPIDAGTAITYANRICENRLQVIGVQEFQFGRSIDWHLDIISGKRSLLIHWSRIHHDDNQSKATGDKRIICELNRHQYLERLGHAYCISRDERYTKAFLAHVKSWIDQNAPKKGVNWLSSVDIAFRVISWLRALPYFVPSPHLDVASFERILGVLYLQGRHIESYLSTHFSPNTHLTGEALGLYYLGTCLPELKRAKRWRNLGRSLLLQQLEKQVRPDGVYFEQSTWYHRYTADFYLHFILLTERAGESLPTHVSERLAALLDYLMWITRPDGTSPYVGDDDGGKLVKLEERAPDDWRAVLSNGAVMFGRGDYKHVAGEFAEETYWLFGPDAREKFERIPAKPPSLTSRAFVDGGFYVMRNGWCVDSNYLLIDCGPHGVMNCGHAHADALSIEVAALGATILVDPGTFTYTGSAELRDLFRSTAMHNTLTIDGFSSSVPAGPFKWKHVANCTLHCWHDHPGFTFFEGSHDGYKRLPDPATHTRTVLFVNKEYWLILDRADATGEHEYAVHFHMAPDIKTTLHQETGELTAHAALATLDIAYFEKQGTWYVADGLVSPCYAAKATAPVGTYATRKNGPVALLSVLFPRTPNQPLPEIRNLCPRQGKGLRLATPRFHDLVLWSGSSAPEEGFYDADFEWAWVRRGSDDRSLEKAVLLHGTTISLQDLEMTAERLLEFVFVSVQEGLLSLDLSPSAGIRVRPPSGIARILVNGGTHTLGSSEAITLSQDEVPTLAVPRDRTDRCQHVRH